MKLFDSEFKVMEVLWEQGILSAGELAKILKDEVGWNRNTTYTVIKKCIDKGVIEREEPNYRCKPMITKEEVQQYEAKEVIGRLFGGSIEKFFMAFAGERKLSEEEATHLKQMVDELKGGD